MTYTASFAIDSLDWNKMDGLLPVIIQCASTQNVLMLGYMNREALETTLESGQVTFFSRSKGRLWMKGETSGNSLSFVSASTDCDSDALLIQVLAKGPTCHTGTTSCFGKVSKTSLAVLQQLETTIATRRSNPAEGSYTNNLFVAGLPRMAQKVGEEGVEVALAGALQANNLAEESADLLYHLIVLLQASGLCLNDVCDVLAQRASARKGF